jgi:hypothetical protein
MNESKVSGRNGRRNSNVRWIVCGLLFLAATVNYADRRVIGILEPILFAGGASSLWMAVRLVGLAVACHQGWSANIYTLVSDSFPGRTGCLCGSGTLARSPQILPPGPSTLRSTVIVAPNSGGAFDASASHALQNRGRKLQHTNP